MATKKTDMRLNYNLILTSISNERTSSLLRQKKKRKNFPIPVADRNNSPAKMSKCSENFKLKENRDLDCLRCYPNSELKLKD